LPAGITVTAFAAAGAGSITLTFGGTPVGTSNAQFGITIPEVWLTSINDIVVAANPSARFNITRASSSDDSDWSDDRDEEDDDSAAAALRPPSDLPKTGDGFPLYTALALLGAALAVFGWMVYRWRAHKSQK